MVTLAVTGASGQLGQLVLQRLRLQAPAGTRIIGCSRDPERLRGLPCDEVRAADFADATSFFDVDPASPSVVARVHRDSEAAVRATGCDCVLLRNGPYLDNMALRVATAAREGVSSACRLDRRRCHSSPALTWPMRRWPLCSAI